MRAMTERRRRRRALNEGGELLLFFGARAPEELPYFGPLMKLPKDFVDINFAFSRAPDQPKRYVQDRIRERAEKVAQMLRDDDCYIYPCGLKEMEAGVIDAFREVCREHGLDWDRLKPELLAKSRLHIEYLLMCAWGLDRRVTGHLRVYNRLSASRLTASVALTLVQSLFETAQSRSWDACSNKVEGSTRGCASARCCWLLVKDGAWGACPSR
jgi:hypothetical protein